MNFDEVSVTVAAPWPALVSVNRRFTLSVAAVVAWPATFPIATVVRILGTADALAEPAAVAERLTVLPPPPPLGASNVIIAEPHAAALAVYES
jgi:hypothetical protein